jgi:hypothetical protein
MEDAFSSVFLSCERGLHFEVKCKNNLKLIDNYQNTALTKIGKNIVPDSSEMCGTLDAFPLNQFHFLSTNILSIYLGIINNPTIKS